MLQNTKSLVLAGLLMGIALVPVHAAEREDVRKVINLVTSVKMPFPESLARNRAKTERVWLERAGMTAGCIRLEERRWCYEFIAPEGNRAEMLASATNPRAAFPSVRFITTWSISISMDSSMWDRAHGSMRSISGDLLPR